MQFDPSNASYLFLLKITYFFVPDNVYQAPAAFANGDEVEVLVSGIGWTQGSVIRVWKGPAMYIVCNMEKTSVVHVLPTQQSWIRSV